MKKPICPNCSTEMKPEYFAGYYESFPMWSCGCKVIPESRIRSGAYGSGQSLNGELLEDHRRWFDLEEA